jgi:hypothetical protein
VTAAREIITRRGSADANANLHAAYNATQNSVSVTPSYVFATPVFGAQLELGATTEFGPYNATVSGTAAATGSVQATRAAGVSDSVTSVGDLYPIAELLWNSGVNNFMAYLTGDVPVGPYDARSLANVGLGHGAVDGGGGYTYLDSKTGRELSVVTGLTYNLVNPSTNYQNGIDWHLDWGLSQTLSKQVTVGAVGYAYVQLTADNGRGDHIGSFESRVFGVGPQISFALPTQSLQASINLKAYWEFDAVHRPSGWNAWATLSLSPPDAAPASDPRAAIVKK